MAEGSGTAAVARSWWAFVIRGVVAIIFGVLAIVLPGATLLTLVLLLAAYLIVDAIFSVIAGARAIRHHERWWLLLLEGLLDAVAAVFILLWPGLTALVLVWAVAVWAIFTGVTELIASAILPAPHGRVLEILSGVVSVALGIVMIALPLIGMVTLVYWIALYALLFGVFQIALAVRLYRHRHAPLGAAAV